VIDFYSGRVLLLGASGKYLKEIAVPPDQRSLSDIAVDSAGTIFLIDGVAGRIYSADKDSSEFAVLAKDIKDYSDFPAGLAVDNKGRIIVSDKNGSKIIVIGRDGSFQGQQLGMGWKEGLLRYPSQICISGTGKLFIADRGNNRIQIFSISE
jgi:sugar lactone lactonase YvrE